MQLDNGYLENKRKGWQNKSINTSKMSPNLATSLAIASQESNSRSAALLKKEINQKIKSSNNCDDY